MVNPDMAYLLQQLLEETARRQPDRPAVKFGERTLTYRELDDATDRFARLLLGIGLPPGALVGVHLRRSVEALIAMIGILKAGSAYVPLDPQSPAGRLRYIMDICGIAVVATTSADLDGVDGAIAGSPSVPQIVVMDGVQSHPSSVAGATLVSWPRYAEVRSLAAPAIATIDTDPAYVLFTSGSTGAPKGVVISHLNALTFIETVHDFFGISSEDRLSQVCPLQSDMSVFDIFVAMKAGACIIGIPEGTAMFPMRLAQTISGSGISVWNSVPSALSGLAGSPNLEKFDLSALRLVLFAGEVFPIKALRRLMAVAPQARFCNMYGQTEANSSTYHWVGSDAEDSQLPIPIGRALPNFEVFALGSDGRRVVEPGGEGELHIRSSTVAIGYWGDPERTAQAFIANPIDPISPRPRDRVYKTGDIVRIHANGEFVFVGRRDLMIKSRGYRIEIDEIEGTLRNHPAIRNAAVVAIPDERIGNRLAAFIEPIRPGSVEIDEVLAYCSHELPHYMVPSEISFCDTLPLTASGKVDRQRLARP